MKKLLSIFIFLSLINDIKAQEIEINQNFYSDTEIYPFSNIQNIYGLNFDGQSQLNSDTSLIRLVLIDNFGNEYLLFETYSLMDSLGSFTFTHKCEETCLLDSIKPSSLKIELINASIFISKLYYLTQPEDNMSFKILQLKNEKHNEKIQKLNEQLESRGMLWRAGITSLSKLSFSQREKIFGHKYNFQGYEYYIGGIFERIGVPKIPKQNNSTIVKKWDWRERHRANNPSSLYYDDDPIGSGWMTPVKCMSGCWDGTEILCDIDSADCVDNYYGEWRTAGTCWAWGTVGAAEAMLNTYYNQHLDFDLSEQEIVACEWTVSNTDLRGDPANAMHHFCDEGVVDENCYPYMAIKGNCNDTCTNPTERIHFNSWNYVNLSDFDNVREAIITHGPLGMIMGTWSHALVLDGYDIIEEGDTIHLTSWGTWFYIIPPNSPYIGQTYLIQKQSVGYSWGDNGYMYDMNMPSVVYRFNLQFTSLNYDDSDIQCFDKDGDGYYNWGIGSKPLTCPTCPDEEDCDDSDPMFGPYDQNYYCTLNCNYFTYSDMPLYISSDETWVDIKYINRDLIIESGATLTIKDKVVFHRDAKLIIEHGAKLVVENNSILTNTCGDFWQGIIVKGNDTLPQTAWNQGSVYLRNGATIENAITAVKVEGGGAIQASNSHFLNNRYDVIMEPYSNPNNPSHNVSYFTNCTFVVNDDALDYCVAHVKLDNVSGINFRANTFRCDMTEPPYWNDTSSHPTLYANGRSIGIWAQNADFKVLPGCATTIQPYGVPCPNPLKNTFEGLYYGIKANSVSGADAVYIQQCDFIDNYRGILLENLNNPTVISNHFDAGYTGLGTDLYQTYPPYYGNSTYSLYLNGCTGYTIEENNMENGDGGIYIYNSGNLSNQIYKNSFVNVNHINQASALTALGTNYDDIYEVGLQFTCNNFTTNQYNMSVVGNSTINKNQGSNALSTGNVSDHVHLNDECEFFVDLNSPLNYSYFWYPPDSSEYIQYHTDTLNKFTLLEASNSNLCPSHTGQPDPIFVIQDQRLSLADDIINQQNLLSSLVDGGDTPELLNEVNNLTHQNYWQTCINLLNVSPYLSDTVLKTFMFNSLYRPIAKTLVLLANSPLPMSVRYRIDETNLGYWFKWYLKQFQTGTNAREEKEMEIMNKKTENSRLLYLIVSYGNFMADTLSAYRDSVMNVLDNEQDFDKDRFFIPLLIKTGQYEVTTQIINDLETYANTLPDAQRFNLIDYCNYLRVVNHYVQNNYDQGIIKQYRSTLEEWAKNNNTLVQIPAQILLEQTYTDQFDYPEKIIFPEKNRSKTTVVNIQNIEQSIMENNNDMLSVFPNPSDKSIMVEYVNMIDNQNQMIGIYDMQGHLLKQKIAIEILGIITFDVSDLSAGNYIVKMGAFKKQITVIH